MANEVSLMNISRQIYASMASSQHYAVKLNSSDQAVVCSTQGERPIGIVQDNPATGYCTIMVFGMSKCVLGGTVALYDPLTVSSSGTLIKANDVDEYVLGYALAAGSSTETISMMITHSGSVAEVQKEAYVSSGNYSSSGQYTAVKEHTTAGQIVQCSVAGERALGILQNAPAASAEAEICVGGQCTGKAGTGGLTAGQAFAVDSDGTLIAATGSAVILGWAEAAISEGATGAVFFAGGGINTVAGSALASAKVWVGNGSGLAAAVTLSGDVTNDNTGATTIGAKKVTAAKMYSAAQGAIFRTDATNAVSELSLADGKIAVGDGTDVAALSAKTSGQILVGNGTTLASVAVSGDATLAANGALTIAADKVDVSKMASTAGGGAGIIFKGTNTANAISELNVGVGHVVVGTTNDITTLDMGATAGNIMVDSGTAPASVAVSGDATLAAAGTLTLAKNFIRTTTVDIAAANVITLDATPVVLVDFSALQGAGTISAGDALIFHGAILNIYGGADSYDQNENCTVVYQTAGGGATVSLTLANFFNAGADGKLSTLKPIATDVAPDVDEDLVIKCSASPKNVQGDRNCRVTVYYSVFTPHA